MPRPLPTKEKFVDRAITVHGDKYTYNNVVIVNKNPKVFITCPVHGDFLQDYRKHLEGRGCRKCAGERHSVFISQKLSLPKEEWFKRAKEKHGDRYDYSLVQYVDYKTKVEIVCQKHGVFVQNPRRHLDTNGCYKCGREITSAKTRNKYSVEKLIEKFNKVHNNKYTYPNLSLDNYSTVNHTLIDFVCPEHGATQQRLASHLKGNGCNKCRYFGYSRSRYLDNCKKRGHQTSSYYAIKFFDDNESFIKLGITVQGVHTRYRKIKERGNYRYEILFDIPLAPDVAWDVERKNKSKYLALKYQPKNDFPGSTECFTMDLPINQIAADIAENKF
jgi:hypothetical protein